MDKKLLFKSKKIKKENPLKKQINNLNQSISNIKDKIKGNVKKLSSKFIKLKKEDKDNIYYIHKEKPYKKLIYYNDPKKIYDSMLNDIKKAKLSIYLETYIFDTDEIGKKFRSELVKKAKEGVVVILILDGWGAQAEKEFFKDIEFYGGEVNIFKPLNISINHLVKNHTRNHRKLLVVDGKIVYVGSTNITLKCLDWRESTIRLTGPIAKTFEIAFLDNLPLCKHCLYSKKEHVKNLNYNHFRILRDVPSFRYTMIRNEIVKLIKFSKKSIIIESPYFIPDRKVRNALKKASERGVKIDIFTPKDTDIFIVELLREKYLGEFAEKKINIFFYKKMLHSKIMIVDEEYFMIGSSNMDYRSFFYQHEIVLRGKDKFISSLLLKSIKEIYLESIPFDYDSWKKRSLFRKLIENIINLFRWLI
jgi:cardiolipin synthase A/B